MAVFVVFCRNWKTNYRVNPIITKVGLISINFIWSSINFSKPGMKNFKAGRKFEKNSKLQDGMQGTVANGTVAAGSSKEHSAFCYGIAKISNFTRIAKLGIFARLAKFR